MDLFLKSQANNIILLSTSMCNSKEHTTYCIFSFYLEEAMKQNYQGLIFVLRCLDSGVFPSLQ